MAKKALETPGVSPDMDAEQADQVWLLFCISLVILFGPGAKPESPASLGYQPPRGTKSFGDTGRKPSHGCRAGRSSVVVVLHFSCDFVSVRCETSKLNLFCRPLL